MNQYADIRLPPQNLDAERGVIGSVLLMPEAIDEISSLIGPDDFYSDPHRKLYQSIGTLYRRGVRGIDAVTVCEELCQRGELTEVGGPAYIGEILDNVPHAAHVRYYARLVREKSRLRNVIYLCQETLQQAYVSSDSDELIADLDSRTMRLRHDGTGGDLSTLKDAIDDLEAYEHNPGAVGKTGLTELDRLLSGGFREAQSIVLAARPGAGKSALGCQFIRTAAERDEPALIISLEMLKREIAGRYAQTIDRETLRGLPVYLDDSTVSASKISGRIRYAHRRYGIRIVLVDYLQLIEPEDKKSHRERQVAEVSRAMKLLARELRIPIVICCQLNRQSANEKRKPRLSDMRESGAIEQDADVVLMLHETEEGDSEILVGKNRGGACGLVKVIFDKPTFTFRGVDENHWTGKL